MPGTGIDLGIDFAQKEMGIVPGIDFEKWHFLGFQKNATKKKLQFLSRKPVNWKGEKRSAFPVLRD